MLSRLYWLGWVYGVQAGMTINNSDKLVAIEDTNGYCWEVRSRRIPVPFNLKLPVAYSVRLSEIYRWTFGGPPDLIYPASPASLGF
ncbi:hypothetical protein F4782DRAFT_41710 [Xylaria castorea]|nr:hypothetical protein F4782DRAFT_41710 [Xylaria castorea]